MLTEISLTNLYLCTKILTIEPQSLRHTIAFCTDRSHCDDFHLVASSKAYCQKTGKTTDDQWNRQRRT